jgi:hypothetical protein
MAFEPVYMVWDYYDGILSGIASYAGAPHYFELTFDPAQDDYSEVYELWPIDQPLLNLAQEQWQIYRAWEMRFHLGEVSGETHPGHRGQDARYDELEDQIHPRLKSFGGIPSRARADFRPVRDQPERPVGCFREMEVEWSSVEALPSR